MLEKDLQKDTRNETEIALDRDYETEKRRHKERIKRLDRFFEYVTHPFCMFVVTAVCLIVSVTVSFFGIYYEIPAVKEAAVSMLLIAGGLTAVLIARVLWYVLY